MNSIYQFKNRHIGPDDAVIKDMLKVIGANSVDEMIDQIVPEEIRHTRPLKISKGLSEYEYIKSLRNIAAKNELYKSYIGLGYYSTIMPAVIQRNIFENPGWYTAYTPYQAEISQGRLEALLNYQTMICELTGLPIANASLLDEGTAAAEAMLMFFHAQLADKGKASKFFVSQNCFPQTIDVLETRSEPLGIELVIGDISSIVLDHTFFGLLIQYPDVNGEVVDFQEMVTKAHEQNIQVCVASDLLALAILNPPGEWGADCVVGNSQRFGMPLGFGGPHAGFFSCKDRYKRMAPGRIIGVSKDADGKTAYRMALQTREQHIKREKATSNLCTAQALPAIIAGMYAVYHGPKGIKSIAYEIHFNTCILFNELTKMGYRSCNEAFFDTLVFEGDVSVIRPLAEERRVNLRYVDDARFALSVDQTTTPEDLKELLDVFAKAKGITIKSISELESSPLSLTKFIRTSSFLQHPVFNKYHSETEMMRYIKRLENKDLSLVHSMISLGSCTMKLNAASELLPLTWPEFTEIHPFAPLSQAKGYLEVIDELSKDLCEITGFKAISFQPNSGAQGEYAGLMVIKAYHKANRDQHRNITLIPSSAHGTNPASAAMAGLKIVIVACDREGNIDVNDLRDKAQQFNETLACLMVTYPSTHGVYEESIREIVKIIHDNGGLVYMDGANMNAQVGLTSPGHIGADVCHLNLHKTFAIPHGGGGPGMGPIAVAEHLVPFLPSHISSNKNESSISAVSSAPFGSALVLLISYGYIKMLGADGLLESTKIAILNANYLKDALKGYYKILFTGKNNRCAHEFIIDCSQFKQTATVEVGDIAKRLMDYGFHAPTVGFPVHDTLMIEPTESESKQELDKFISAMISIRREIDEIIQNEYSQNDNVLKNAPHTMNECLKDHWNKPYGRDKAAFPSDSLRDNKFWPSVSRIDNALGDRNLICTCAPIESYAETS
ncbi:MAG: aminomethyl-transferring glycine dehydrogenase [Pedobacter sp.]|jgi:glycine dehydrogenase|uniref:aminomethyl-transferring glycine dehydrogenase n=1 Tax=Pedobacter sp. TaxID=1411316 RepID=UPI0035690FD6